jgi:hypothetical protein
MKPSKVIAWLLILAQLAGCASPAPPAFQVAPGFAAQHAGTHRIGVLVDARVRYTSLSDPGNASDAAKSAELSAQGRTNVQDALNRELAGQGYTVVMLPMDDDARALVAEFDAARGHNLSRPFPATNGAIGAVAPLPAAAAIAAKNRVDAIVIISGRDSATSVGEKVLAGVAITAVVLLVGAIFVASGSPPPALGPGPHAPPYDADFVMLDSSGKILAYERSNMAVLDRNSVDRANAHFSGVLHTLSR